MSNQDSNSIKSAVKDAYTKAIEKSGSGCCGGGNGSPTDTMKGSLVKLAGYSSSELQSLPADAVENAFGCGNPLAFSGVKEGDVVVDIGSGAGIDCLIASKIVGDNGKVIGLDMTPKMIEKATENIRRAGANNVEFRLGDADDMPIANGIADWVISNCVINLAPDKDKVFAEIFRVLKPGGRVSISDVVLGTTLPEQVRTSISALVGCVAGALEETDYLQKMREAGLQEVKVTDRIVYDRSQIKGLTEGECGCCDLEKELEPFLPQIDEQIWSAKISAKKPQI